MKVLIFGITGMLGNAMFRVLSDSSQLTVIGTSRSVNTNHCFFKNSSSLIISGVDVENYDLLIKIFTTVQPNIVINCIGLVKQIEEAHNPLQAISINSLLPHRLAMLCETTNARLIHISTDCVFSGAKGNYLEADFPDANDLYGRSKLLGEVNYPHAITLRTSIIGHEIFSQRSLVGWFLSQNGSVKGFKRAVFSGLPTVELAHLIRNIIIPNTELNGLYHIAAKPINKFDLLNMIAQIYAKNIEIISDESLSIDRSLNAEKFKNATGYVAPEWPVLISKMNTFK